MKFALDKQHRDFFQKNGFIELEDVLSSNQLTQWNQAIDSALGSIPTATNRKQMDHLFSKSRDLWRLNDTLRQFTTGPRLAELVSELVEKKPIRLGYTQFFPQYMPSLSYLDQTPSVYSDFLHQKTNLETISCVSNVLCGLLIPLSSGYHPTNSQLPENSEIDIFSYQAGSAIIFRPDLLINLELLLEHAGQRYYMIVYTENIAHYYPQPKDPFGHALKHIGYIFNDKLSDRLNPIVYR